MYEFRAPQVAIEFPLYKYFSNLSYVKDVIVNRQVHLEIPASYNDIFDSSFFIDEASLYYLYNYKKHLIKLLGNLTPSFKDWFEKLISEDSDYNAHQLVDELCELYPEVDKESVLNEIIGNLRKMGPAQASNNKVSCFTESRASLLMWAYYANCHRGVCLGFDFSDDPLLKYNLHKVFYSDQRAVHMGGFTDYYWKSSEWAHEKEWRIVCDTESEYLPTSALRSITLGARMPDNEREELTALAEKNKLEVWESRPSDTKYALEFQKIFDGKEML